MNRLRILSLLWVLVPLGCDSGNGPEPDALFVPAEIVEWRTEGGGNLYFNVRRKSPSEFAIDVIQKDFRPIDVSVTLTREASLPNYDLLVPVFDGKLNLAGVETPERGETGTWTSIYVVDSSHQRHKVTSSHVCGELRALRYWVEDQLEARPASAAETTPDQ